MLHAIYKYARKSHCFSKLLAVCKFGDTCRYQTEWVLASFVMNDRDVITLGLKNTGSISAISSNYLLKFIKKYIMILPYKIKILYTKETHQTEKGNFIFWGTLLWQGKEISIPAYLNILIRYLSSQAKICNAPWLNI